MTENSSPSAAPEEPSRARTRGRRIALIAGGILALCCVGGASAYGVYYGAGHRALPGTSVGDVSVSGMTADQISEYVTRAASNEVTIEGDRIAPKTTSLADMGVTVDAAKTAEDALAANSSFMNYVKAPFTRHTIEPTVNADAAKLREFAVSLTDGVVDTFPATEPSAVPNEDKSAFVALEGKNGQGVNPATLLEAARSTVSANAPQTASVTIGDVAPAMSFDDAKAQAEAANALLKPEVKVKVGDETASPSPADRVAWVSVPALTEADTAPHLNADAVREWATKSSESLNVKRVDGVRYVNSSGNVVLEKVKAVNGASVSNIDAVTDGIVQASSTQAPYEGAFETAEDTAEWKETRIADGAENLAYPAAPGEKWIDVNLSTFTATAYEGATVTHGPIQTVIGAPATPTITGTFTIQRKLRTDTMRGRNADGSRYETPDVPYAMYFSGGYALHGAPWRSSFGYGGSSGSHGCVNLPVGDASWLYGWAPPGTVVSVHR